MKWFLCVGIVLEGVCGLGLIKLNSLFLFRRMNGEHLFL